MKGNPYWNTLWSERDGEFLWSGTKFGFVLGAIIVPATIITIKSLYQEFKEILKKD